MIALSLPALRNDDTNENFGPRLAFVTPAVVSVGEKPHSPLASNCWLWPTLAPRNLAPWTGQVGTGHFAPGAVSPSEHRPGVHMTGFAYVVAC